MSQGVGMEIVEGEITFGRWILVTIRPVKGVINISGQDTVCCGRRRDVCIDVFQVRFERLKVIHSVAGSAVAGLIHVHKRIVDIHGADNRRAAMP